MCMRRPAERGVPNLERRGRGAGRIWLEQTAGNRSDFILQLRFHVDVIDGEAGRVAAITHYKRWDTILIRQWHIEVFGIEIFAAANMDAAQEAPRLFAFQNHVANFDPAGQMLGRDAVFKTLAGVFADNFGQTGADEAESVARGIGRFAL